MNPILEPRPADRHAVCLQCWSQLERQHGIEGVPERAVLKANCAEHDTEPFWEAP